MALQLRREVVEVMGDGVFELDAGYLDEPHQRLVNQTGDT